MRSLKGHNFDILNRLGDKGLIFSSKKAKSVCCTEKGVELAEEIKKK